MIKFAARIAAVAGAALLAASFGLPAQLAHASQQVCAQSVDLDSCNDVTGSGLHITSMVATVYNEGDTADGIHIELSGPNGLIKNCAQVNIGGGGTTSCSWDPNANETAGNYCSDTWQDVSGTYTDRGHACVDVFS